MKKIFLPMLCAMLLAFTAVGAEETASIFLQSGDMVNISERYAEDIAKTEYFSIKEEDSAQQLLSLDGAGKIIGSEAVGENFCNFILEADIKQTACTGASSGVFSIGLRSAGTTSTQYRIVYVSALNYNESTHKFGGGTIVGDRLAIARTSGSDKCDTWYYAAVSEKPLGILKDGATPWIHLRAVMTDNGLELAAYDESGQLLSSITSSMKELNMGIEGLPVVQKGGIMFSSHSSNVDVKNVTVTPIDEYSGIRLVPEYKTMYKGQTAAVKVTDAQDRELYKKAYTSKEITEGNVCFDSAGEKKVKASVKDIITGKEITASCDIQVAEKIQFSALSAELAETGIARGASTECTVWGIAADGTKYKVHADISGDGVQVNGTKISSAEPGDHPLSIRYEGLQTTVTLHVSQFYNIRLVPCRDHIVMWDQLYFDVEADGQKIAIDQNQLQYEEAAFLLENGRLKANRTGVQHVSAKFDSVTVSAEVEVLAKKDGVVLLENFESEKPLSEYMQYRTDRLVKLGENTVYSVNNEITDFFGAADWKDYKIDFKLKIDNPAIEKDQYAGVFEIIPRRKIPEEDMFGGDKGIPFVIRTSHNISEPHMRISAAPGPNINIEDGEWHDVSVEVNGCQMIFTIDNEKMYYTGSFPKQGYFSFRASNVSAYIDDVQVTLRSDDSDGQADLKNIVCEKTLVKLPAHDAFSIAAMTAVKAYYSDGTSRYLDLLNEVQWSIAEGEDIINLSRNRGIKPKKAGKAKLCGEVGGKSFLIELEIYEDGLTDQEYADSTLRQRRETYLYSLQKGYDEGVTKGVGGLGNLASYYGEMLMYPRTRDYSELLDWHSLQAEYEDTVVGRGNDGGDFIILQMINIYNRLRGKINASEESFEKMKEYLCSVRYPEPSDWMSENHKGVFYATAVLVGETFPEARVMENMTGKALYTRYISYLKAWVNQRIRRGFLEYDSAHYYNVDIYTFEHLYAVAKDPELKKMAEDMLNYLYADILSDSLEDTMTGAHSRLYAGMSYTTKLKMLEIMFDLSTVAFDETGVEKAVQDAHILFGEFQPCAAVCDMAYDREKRFANKERRSIYAIPDDLLIEDTMEKYTYTTPTYSLGCVVHVDDLEKYRSSVGNYQPVTSTYPVSTRRNIIQGQQEIPWSLQFAGGSDTLIYEGHPGPYGPAAATHAHGYFAGDLHCNCYQYFQDENVSIGMHKITRAGEAKFTHFWLPRNNFEQIYEQDGWIFISHKGTYAAIKPLRDGMTNGTLYCWGNPQQKYNNAYPLDQVEVRVDSADTAFVCEVHEASEYEDFEEFCADMIDNTQIRYNVGSDYFIEYTSTDGKTLKIDYNHNSRYLDGEYVDTHQYKMQDSQYVSADYDAGKIQIGSGENRYEIKTYAMDMDAKTALQLIEKVNSFTQQLKSCSKSRLKALLDSGGTDVLNAARTIQSYQETNLSKLCRKSLEKAAESLEQAGVTDMAHEIKRILED